MFGQPYYSAEGYTFFLLKLFPPGPAFARDPFSSFFKLISGFAPELSRIDVQINGLVGQSIPTGAVELIGEWEKDYGFPGCLGIPLLLADRQSQLFDKVVWPGNLATGWSDTGNVTAGSDIIDGLTDHTDLLVGDAITIADGIGGGKYEILEKQTPTSIRIEQTAIHTAAAVQLVGFFNRGEASRRYYDAVALYLGYTINSVTIFPSLGLGVSPNDFSSSAESVIGSPILIGIGDTSDIIAGKFVSHPGFQVGEHKAIAVTASTITLDVSAIANNAGGVAIGYDEAPFGMNDPVGDGFRHVAAFDISLNLHADGVLLACVFEKMRQSHVEFIYTFS